MTEFGVVSVIVMGAFAHGRGPASNGVPMIMVH